MKKKKVVFFIWNMSNCGGTERVLSIIANGLSAREYQVSILSYEGIGTSYFSLRDGINIYWLEREDESKNRKKWILFLKKVYRMSVFIRNERPNFLIDVDIANGYISLFVKNFVSDLHWMSWEHFNYDYQFEQGNHFQRMIRKVVCRYTEQLIVLTKETKRGYQANTRIGYKITQIYNPMPYTENFLKQAEKPVIFAAGRLVDVKGFDLLIHSWRILENRYPEWSVLVAGEGKNREKLERQVKQEGIKHFYFIGNVDSIEKYYSEAAFFVLPSRNEPFGMVLIEAMYFSLPVVSYACKTGPKEIIEDGENGFLIQTGDIKEFAKKMEILMRDKELRRKMGKTAQKSVRKFDKDKILDQWEILLK